MHQYLFFIGDFPIRAYGVMLALAIISGASVAYFLLKRMVAVGMNISSIFLLPLPLQDLLEPVYGMYFFFDWHYYSNHLLEIPYVWQGGMAIQGGVVFGTLAGFWFVKNTISMLGPLPMYLHLPLS